MAKAPFDLSPGLIGGPPDAGSSPNLPIVPPANPGQPAPTGLPSGVEAAMGQMADQMHPVKLYSQPKRHGKRTPL